MLKFRREGTDVEIVGMNEASSTLVDKLAVYDRPDAERLMGTDAGSRVEWCMRWHHHWGHGDPSLAVYLVDRSREDQVWLLL